MNEPERRELILSACLCAGLCLAMFVLGCCLGVLGWMVLELTQPH